jgi:type IV pilus assembly protein PilM
MGLPFLSGKAKKRDHIVAIDLGGRTTKAVYLQRRGERFSLLNYAMVDAPIYDKSMSADLLAEHLRSIGQALGSGRSRPVTLALGVADTLFRQVEVPLMPVSDVRQMLKFNSKNYLQQDLPDHVFDCCYIAGAQGLKSGEGAKPISGGQKQKVMVGGAKKQLIEDVQTAIRSAGLVPDQVVPGLVGPCNAFEMAEPEVFAREVVALVDIGFKNSTISILEAGELMLNRVVGIGGDRLTSGLAEAMNISYNEAEQIKVGMAAEVQPSLEPLLSPLGRELRASIDFFEHQRDKAVAQVFISGGSARSEFIVAALQNELMVTCKSWNPTSFLEMELSPEKMSEVGQAAPQLAVAIGAAVSTF